MAGIQNQEGSFTDEAVSYGQTTEPGETIPVIDDSKVTAEGMDTLDSRTADSNAQLERDEREAIDKKNVLKGDRLRHAQPVGGGYQEKEEDDLPAEVEDTGKSSMRQ